MNKTASPASAALVASVILLLFSISALFSGCTPKTREPGPLRIWLDLTAEEAEVFEKILGSFENITEIKTALEVKPHEEIARSFDSSSLKPLDVPDLVGIDIRDIGRTRDRVRDLTGYTLEELDTKYIYKFALEPGISHNRIYFIPYRMKIPGMIYNCREITEPPETWDELFQDAQARPGKIAFQGLGDEDLALVLISFIWQGGGDPFNLNHPLTRESFYFLQKFGPFISMSSRAFNGRSLAQAQSSGEILLHFNLPDMAMRISLDGAMPFPNCSAPLPRGPKASTVAATARYLAVPLTSRHAEEAVKCMRYLTTIIVQKAFADQFYWLPVRREAWPLNDKFKSDTLNGFMDSTQRCKAMPLNDDIEAVWDVLIKAYNEIVFDGSDVSETLAKHNARMEKILK